VAAPSGRTREKPSGNKDIYVACQGHSRYLWIRAPLCWSRLWVHAVKSRCVAADALKLLERVQVGGHTIVGTLANALLRVESEGREFGMVPALACHSERLHFVRDTLV